MRQVIVGCLVVVCAAASVVTPWMHVHEHHYDADHDRQHASFTIHGHGLPGQPPGSLWRARSADEDARFLGMATVVRDGSPAPVVSLIPLSSVASVRFALLHVVADPAPVAHGPPGLASLIPRAPPA